MCLLQVTPSGARCVSGPARAAVAGSPWRPRAGAHVVAAAANDALQALVATSDGRLALLQGGGEGLSAVSEAPAPAGCQVSCLDVSPLTPAGATPQEEARNRDARAEVALGGLLGRQGEAAGASLAERGRRGGAGRGRGATVGGSGRDGVWRRVGGGGGGGGGRNEAGASRGGKRAADGGGAKEKPSLSALGAHALMSLGDGRVLAWRLVEGSGGSRPIELAERRSVALGSRAALLAPFRRGGGGGGAGASAAAGGDGGGSRGGSSSSPPASAPAGASTAVLAACDRPAVIHCSNRKLVFSNVNAPLASAASAAAGTGAGGEGGGGGGGKAAAAPASADVTHFSRFNSRAFPGGGALAIARPQCLSVGTVDSIQRLHVRSVPLGEQPRRLAHQAETGTLAVTVDGAAEGEEGAAFPRTPTPCLRTASASSTTRRSSPWTVSCWSATRWRARSRASSWEAGTRRAAEETRGGEGGGARSPKGGGRRGDVAMADASAAASSSCLLCRRRPVLRRGHGALEAQRARADQRAAARAARRLRRGDADARARRAAHRPRRGLQRAGIQGDAAGRRECARVALRVEAPRPRETEEEAAAAGTGSPTLEHVASHSGHILALYTASAAI